jgi:hypothetical protein
VAEERNARDAGLQEVTALPCRPLHSLLLPPTPLSALPPLQNLRFPQPLSLLLCETQPRRSP